VTSSVDRVAAFVDALVKDRRPPRWVTDRADAAALRAAAALHATRPGADAPRSQFVERLRQQLARIDDPAATRGLTRRRLLWRLGVPAGAAVAGAVVATAVRTSVDLVHTPDGTSEDEEMLVPSAGGSWVALMPLADLPENQPVAFRAGAVQGFVVRSQDEVSAISGICTHLGCLLAPSSQSERLECPCHGATFALDGSPLNHGYTTPLPHLLARVVDGTVEVFSV
jgi:nitrite reductase/ring-hydroxylating ferredoxin subunit